MKKTNKELVNEIFDIVHEIKDDEDKLLRVLDFLKNGGLDEFEFIGGLFNDDGTRIDEESIPMPSKCVLCKNSHPFPVSYSSLPMPSKCVLCKKNQSGDWEEDILCKLTRADQANDIDHFECASFESI